MCVCMTTNFFVPARYAKRGYVSLVSRGLLEVTIIVVSLEEVCVDFGVFVHHHFLGRVS